MFTYKLESDQPETDKKNILLNFQQLPSTFLFFPPPHAAKLDYVIFFACFSAATTTHGGRFSKLIE